MNTPAVLAPNVALPELPEPAGHSGIPAFAEFFTAEQMRGYALATLRASLAQQGEAVAWGVFAYVDGEWVLQYPVRFTEKDAHDDLGLYAEETALEVRPLFTHPAAVAVDDYRAHHDDFRVACLVAQAHAPSDADRRYWQHQVDVLDRIKANPAPPTSGEVPRVTTEMVAEQHRVLDRIEQIDARRAARCAMEEAKGIIAALLKRDSSPHFNGECGCINHSRKAEREYEAGTCPHQLGAAFLAANGRNNGQGRGKVCGGCGETDEDKRCVGCLHVF